MMPPSFGPDCPKCGCPMSLIDAGSHAARPWAAFGCDFCKHRQDIGRRPLANGQGGVVVYNTLRCKCPKCAAKNPPVTSTSGAMRWHKCAKCRHPFQSMEV
jgi:hypothetical protein